MKIKPPTKFPVPLSFAILIWLALEIAWRLTPVPLALTKSLTDSLYIAFSSKPSTESQGSGGVVLDYDAEGNLVGIDMYNSDFEDQVGENHGHVHGTQGYLAMRNEVT